MTTVQENKLYDSAVIQMRREVRLGQGKTDREYSEQYGVGMNAIANARRGRSFQHLNDNHPPVKQDPSKPELKAQARALYLQGVPYRKIITQLNVSKASVSLWCRDIVRPRTPAKPREVVKPTRKFAPVDDIVAKHKAGWRHEDIGKEIGMSPKTVARHCVGIPRDVPLINRGSIQERTGPLGEGPYKDYHVYFWNSNTGPKVIGLIHRDTGKKQSIRYARYLMGVHLGRILENDEVVRYREGQVDEIDNLILTKVERRDLASKYVPEVKPCKECQKEFTARRRVDLFCSKKCRWDHQYKLGAPPRKCRGCGEDFQNTNRSVRYCGDTCKTKAVDSQQSKRRKTRLDNAPVKVECVVCEAMFIPRSENRDYCYSAYCKDVIENSGET